MGKAALILVAAVTVASGAAYMNQDRAAFDSVKQEALYEHQVLAREIAQSGFNRLESRVRRDFNSHRANDADVAHSQGRMDLAASGDAGGPVTITATGYFQDAEYTITGTLAKSGTRILDALTVDGVLSDVTMASGAKISGIDTNFDGTSGENMDVHAVLTDENDSYTELISSIVSGNAPGTAGLLDIVSDNPEISLSTLAANIASFSGPVRVDYDDDTTLENQSVGSTNAPAVVVVDGNLTLSGTTSGVGILYVDGDLSLEDSATWRGLVMVDNDGGDHTFSGSSAVYGAVIIRSVYATESSDPDDGGLPGGHFDVDVFDDFGAGDYRYHQHKYDDEYDATGLDLLGPDACGSGGLCWSSILGDEDAVYVEFVNADMGYGTFEIQAGEGSVTETCDDDGGGSGGDDDDDDGGDDDDDDGGDDDDDLVVNGMPTDVRMAGFSGISWFTAVSSRLLNLFPSYAGGGKIYMCHIPPGNPSNAHTIYINENAKQAHLNHGDSMGECSDDDDDGGDSDDDDDGGDSDDDDDGGDSDDDDDGGDSDDDDDGGDSDDDDDGGDSDDDDDGGDSDDDDDGGDSDDDDDGGSSCTPSGDAITVPAVDLSGNTHEGLSPTLLDARQATTFQINFEYLCALQISSPNGVIYDPTDRNDAFTIRIYSASHNGSSWTQGDKVYEVSAYHHTGYGWDYNPGGEICDPTDTSDGTLAGASMDLELGGTAKIQYSSAELYRVRDLLTQVNPGQGSISLQSVREEGVRPHRRNLDQ